MLLVLTDSALSSEVIFVFFQRQEGDEGDLEDDPEGNQMSGPSGRRPFWRRRRYFPGPPRGRGRGRGYRGGPPPGRGGYQVQGYFPRGGGMYREQPRFYSRQYFRPRDEQGGPRGGRGGRRPYNRRRRPRQDSQKGDAPQVQKQVVIDTASCIFIACRDENELPWNVAMLENDILFRFQYEHEEQ